MRATLPIVGISQLRLDPVGGKAIDDLSVLGPLATLFQGMLLGVLAVAGVTKAVGALVFAQGFSRGG